MAAGQRRGRPATPVGARAEGGRNRSAGKVRIIGGTWRGRRLPVANAPGLRPSTDRVRETLFNWLQDMMSGARCLDLFAGSGALGLEALSRGAAHCTFVDTDARNLEPIGILLKMLEAGDRGQCTSMCATAFLSREQQPYDLIFLDPPFGSGLLAQVATQLHTSGACHTNTRIYVEQDAHDRASALPADWQTVREKRAGNVRYGLYGPAPATH